jgi:protoheme ferro-lyase
MATAVIQRFSKQRHINTEDKRLWIVSMSPLVRCERNDSDGIFKARRVVAMSLFFLLSEQPSIWNNMTRLGGDNPRKAMRIPLYPKKSSTTHKTSNEKGELLERFQEMPSTPDRPVDPFLVMAMIAVPK